MHVRLEGRCRTGSDAARPSGGSARARAGAAPTGRAVGDGIPAGLPEIRDGGRPGRRAVARLGGRRTRVEVTGVFYSPPIPPSPFPRLRFRWTVGRDRGDFVPLLPELWPRRRRFPPRTPRPRRRRRFRVGEDAKGGGGGGTGARSAEAARAKGRSPRIFLDSSPFFPTRRAPAYGRPRAAAGAVAPRRYARRPSAGYRRRDLLRRILARSDGTTRRLSPPFTRGDGIPQPFSVCTGNGSPRRRTSDGSAEASVGSAAGAQIRCRSTR
ncbi:uncharacterized protein [Excalfactoria chinensis]|uniref:uncharacterized protein n=1 Tax=Excalfactoria chinensis TaxID=46218 RepID=UPI003B3ADBF9